MAYLRRVRGFDVSGLPLDAELKFGRGNRLHVARDCESCIRLSDVGLSRPAYANVVGQRVSNSRLCARLVEA